LRPSDAGRSGWREVVCDVCGLAGVALVGGVG
jgi:hypothetical protein